MRETATRKKEKAICYVSVELITWCTLMTWQSKQKWDYSVLPCTTLSTFALNFGPGITQICVKVFEVCIFLSVFFFFFGGVALHPVSIWQWWCTLTKKLSWCISYWISFEWGNHGNFQTSAAEVHFHTVRNLTFYSSGATLPANLLYKINKNAAMWSVLYFYLQFWCTVDLPGNVFKQFYVLCHVYTVYIFSSNKVVISYGELSAHWIDFRGLEYISKLEASVIAGPLLKSFYWIRRRPTVWVQENKADDN